MNKKNLVIGVIAIIIVVAIWWLWPKGANEPTKIIKATFGCADNKTIEAKFINGQLRAVELKLSDGRTINLPQAISASGARYANVDESFVFWNKGDTAFITEGGATTFADCVTK
ncbi:MAG: MliC family protein [Candidatus Paceibacterota bacterium]|jgi:membrane-bound inhibitor of C-type lysozyme